MGSVGKAGKPRGEGGVCSVPGWPVRLQPSVCCVLLIASLISDLPVSEMSAISDC